MALVIDLGIFNRKSHEIHTREALVWTGVWVALALAFSGLVYWAYGRHMWGLGIHPALDGRQSALQFLTGYIVEESLSVDNMVVFAVIFAHFQVHPNHQHRVLYWGILGALLLRGVMIAAGSTLLSHFDWILYVFGALLIVTAVRLLMTDEEASDPEKNVLVRFVRRFYPVTTTFHGNRFFAREDGGRRAMTPLFLVLLVVESSDVLFAVDSIPAVLAVTRDPFLVFTSNVFAILGLRSLYFALAGMVRRFKYLKTSVVILLGFVGMKMLAEHFYAISTSVSLLVIVAILSVGVLASVISARRDLAHGEQR
jgi:tellurite resistance protein TerC